MPKNNSSINNSLFDLLKGKGYSPTMLSTAGKEIPTPDEAEVFQFNFVKDGEDYGKVTLTIDDSSNLIVYYSDDVADSEKETSTESGDLSWYGLLNQLKRFAQRYQLSFELRNTDNLKSDMAKRDYMKKQYQIAESRRVAEMDNRTLSGDRKEQRVNSPEAIAQRKKEHQAELKKVSPEMRKKLRLPNPDKEDVAEGSEKTASQMSFDNSSEDWKTGYKDYPNYKLHSSLEKTARGKKYRQGWEEAFRASKRIEALKKQDVAEGSADKTVRVVKRNGKPIGEIGIDPEASPGNGSYYVKLYDGSVDESGFDTAEEALAELKYLVKQNVAEGSGESYIIVRTDTEGKKDVFAGGFDTYEQAQKELDDCLAHPLHTKYKQKFEIKRKGQQDMAEGNGGHAGSAKVRYTGGMHGEYDPTKKQASPQAHLDAAKYHNDEANKYIAAMNHPKSDQKNKEWYKNKIQHHKNKADFHIQASGQQGVAEGYSLKKTSVSKHMEPGDPEEYTQDVNIKDTDYEIINNKTGQVVGTASQTTNDFMGSGALKITMKNGATRWLDIWDSEKGNPQTAFNRFVKDPKTASKYKGQDMKGVTEMDKSQTPSGRDGHVSHSTYGSRDKGDSTGPERTAKPITAKQATTDAMAILNKQLKKKDMAEGYDDDEEFIPQIYARIIPGTKSFLITKVLDANLGLNVGDKVSYIALTRGKFKDIPKSISYNQGVAEAKGDEYYDLTAEHVPAKAIPLIKKELAQAGITLKFVKKRDSFSDETVFEIVTGAKGLKAAKNIIWKYNKGNYVGIMNEQNVAEGSEWETRHDEFVTVGDRTTPEQINKIVKALIGAAKQADGKRGFLNQIVGKQSNGDLARMAHAAETLAKNIQRNSNAKPGTDERKELGQHLVYAVGLLKRMSGEQDMAEGNQQVSEGYYPMGKQGSYSDAVPTTKIIIQHSRRIEEGEQRYRNIAKIFVENSEGERFAVPTNKPGLARVYARHIAEGGTPYDERGKHITSLVEEYSKMSGFMRATKGKQFNESAQQLVTEAVNYYQSLRESLSKMTGHRGYSAYFESWTPALMEDGEEQETNLNELFVQETLDPRIESVMPILGKLQRKLGNIKQVDELAEWADNIIEGDGRKALNPQGIPEAAGAETLAHNIRTDRSNLKAFDLEETTDVTDDNPKSQGGTRAELLRKYANTKRSTDAEAARRAGASQSELKAAADSTEEIHEGASSQDLQNAILYRVEMRHPDLVSKYGHEYVADKALDVASFYAGAEEIGSSDISAMVNHLVDTLKREAENGLDENLDANQIRAGQLGPTEKVGPQGAVGKLVGAEESVNESEDELARILQMVKHKR